MSSLAQRLRGLLPAKWVTTRLPAADRPRVLLTFDDGPSPDVTAAVLQRLDRYDARAVFFAVGRRVLRAPEALRRVAAAGHVIGNHSFAHIVPRLWRVRTCVDDLQRAQETIQDFGGGTPSLYRPPLGKLTPATLLAARRCGLRLLHWSLETNDWRCRSANDARRVGEHLLNNVADRDVVLLHDDNPYVLDVLDAVLPTLAARFDLNGAAGMFATRRTVAA